MQRQLFLLCLALVLGSSLYGQLNSTLRSQVQYPGDLNDIWGYVAPDGTEYALVGKRDGVSIVSLADPDNAVEVVSIPGQNSTWRDLKTWGEWVYVTTDQGGTTEGVTVIDMREIENGEAPFYHWTPDLPGLGTLQTCHNIYIDEFGYAYLAGCNLNNGGMLYIDVFTTPGEPIYVGAAPSNYAHDVYTRGNLMYASEIYAGRLAIYDVSDKNNTVFLGSQDTPFTFTHNAWLSDDSNFVFTTDEQPNAPIGSYDISDPTDIQELDQYRPTVTLGDGVIPHNVHVWNDFLIISYYTDGGIVVDADRPDNLIEVANFDSYFGGQLGFNGVWGAYPFLPSGLVLLTDIGNGLYVIDVNYVRACYLEGVVTDEITGATLNEVEIVIDSDDEANINFSRLDGTYGTGLAIAGSYDVTFSKPGYIPETVNVDLENGIVTELDVQLSPLPSTSIPGAVVSQEIGSVNFENVANAIITMQNGEGIEYAFNANSEGEFTLDQVFVGNYEVFVGAWGYNELYIGDFEVTENSESVTFELTRGYKDDFALDLGWVTSSDGIADAGFWELGEPIGTSTQGQAANPDFDLPNDLGDQCYVTGNGGGGVGNDDVDAGRVTLTSPVMTLASTYIDPVLEYNLWFFNIGGNGNPNDEFSVIVSNGITEVEVENITSSASVWRDRSSIVLSEVIEITDEMTVIFTTADEGAGHLVEAAVDAFAVTGELLVNSEELALPVKWQVAPSPFATEMTLNYQLDSWNGNGELRVVNALGQTIERRTLRAAQDQLQLGADWAPGVYLLQMEVPGEGVATQKVVKQ